MHLDFVARVCVAVVPLRLQRRLQLRRCLCKVSEATQPSSDGWWRSSNRRTSSREKGGPMLHAKHTARCLYPNTTPAPLKGTRRGRHRDEDFRNKPAIGCCCQSWHGRCCCCCCCCGCCCFCTGFCYSPLVASIDLCYKTLTPSERFGLRTVHERRALLPCET
jgi:hypothetical protein